MQRQRAFQFLLVVSVLVIVSLACGLTDSVDRLREGKEAIETVQGIATQIDESGLQETAQALATEIDESGVKETAQAVATEIDESGVKETVQAVATDIVLEPGEIPPDIPLVGDYFALVGSEEVISYSTNIAYQEVLDFYESQMPANGWVRLDKSSVTDVLAELYYQKPGREVYIVITEIPLVGTVQVVINL